MLWDLSHILTSLSRPSSPINPLPPNLHPPDPYRRPPTHKPTPTFTQLATSSMTSETHISLASYEQAASMVAVLDHHLSFGPTCPEDKRDIEKAMATLTDTHSALWNRARALEESGQHLQAAVQALTSELQELRDAEGAVTHAIKHHRAFISLLTHRIAAHGEDDVATPPLPGSIEAETRQMVRFKLIHQLSFAGADFAGMNMKWRRLKRKWSNLNVQITEARKAERDVLERAKALRATESLLGKDLIKRKKRAEEFGCVIGATRMEDEKS